MNSEKTLAQPSALRAVVGYLLAVTTATACLVISLFPNLIAQHTPSGFLERLSQALLAVAWNCVIVVIAWPPAALVSAVPCYLLGYLASRYGIRNPVFYMSTGCVLGLLAVFPTISAISALTWYTDLAEPPLTVVFWERFNSVAPGFALAGTLAGLTFWVAAGRHFLRKIA